MPIVFLVPAILAGLAALVVPVLLHLRRRERERPMRFPSLMFLQRVTITTARRRRVTDWPLLLVRAAIVALAVLAFARPVLRPRVNAGPARGTRRVVLLLDRSMSMGHAAVWPVALDSARATVNALAPGDRIAVVPFDEEAAIEQPLTTDRSAALAAIDRVRPGSRATRFGSGIRAARELLLKEADASGGEIVLVTDLQRTGVAGTTALTLPPTVQLRAIDVGAKQQGNAAVAGVDVQRLAGAAGAPNRLAVSAHLVARGFAATRRVHVTLTANGRTSGARDVILPATGSVTASFAPVALPIGVIRLVVGIGHDSLTADDSFHAVVPAELTRRVILGVPGDLNTDETLYLERALETGHDPALRVERRNPVTLDATTLRDAVAVILYDVPMPSGSSGAAIAAWVHDGGGLVSVAGRRTTNRTAAAGILPATVGGMVDRTGDRGGILGATSPEHPIFAPLRGAGAPLGGARFYRYPRLTAAADAQIVAQFDDGLPALLERQEGTGRVLMTAMPLDETSGDFPIQPTYLPFVRGLVLHAAGSAAAPLWRTAGDGWLAPAAVRNPVLKTPSGKLLRPDVTRQSMNAVTLDEAGFYTVYDGQPSGDPLAVIAVNSPAAESDLTPMTAGEILVGVGQDSVKASVLITASLAEAERRQSIWRTLLLLAAAALGIEAVMSSRGWRGTAARVVGTAPEGDAT